MTENKIPYKIYLEESEMPRTWYNVRADMKTKPAPLLNPATGKPCTAEELGAVFCDELVKQELDDTTREIPIPQEIRDFYKMYRPSPLVRAYRLEEKHITPSSRASRASPPRPAPGNGAPRSPWPARTWASTARSIWSSAPMSRSPSVVRSCALMARV